MNDLVVFNALSIFKQKLVHMGSRLPIAAFLLLMLFAVSGCESSGSVGGELGPGDDSVTKTTLAVENFETIEANTFSGRLQRSSMGYFEDPLYGNIQAVALLKPSLSRVAVDTIRDDATMSIMLKFSNAAYGIDGTVSNFEIFEADQIWRGNELKYNNEVSVDFSSKVAEFQVTDEDSIEVELSDEWVQKFRSYFEAPSASRDSSYINEFPGLAIVPAQTNERIHFLRHTQEEEDSPAITRFLVYSEAFEPDDDDEDGDEGGPFFRSLGLRDWGSSVVRSNEPASNDGIVLHNTERVLRVDLDIPEDELKNKNIVNASLVFTLRTDVDQFNPNITRNAVEAIRGHSFRTVPSDLVSELFVNNPRFLTGIDEETNIFRLDITQYVLNEVYGNSSEGPIFISLQAINGFLYSAHFYDETSAESLRPKIVITSVE